METVERADAVRAALRDAVAALASIDATELADAELHALVVAMLGGRNGLTAAASTVLHAWEEREAWRADGSLRAAHALARDTKANPDSARLELRRAAWLEQWSATRAAVLDGRLSIDHVDLLMRYVTKARSSVYAAHEAFLIDRLAGRQVFDDAQRDVRYWADLADDLLGREPRRHASSALYASRLAVTGELVLDGHLGPIDAEVVAAELQRLAEQVRLDDTAAGTERTPAQRRAVALVRMATRSASLTVSGIGTAEPRPLFQVVVGDESMRRLCELASGTVLRPEHLLPHVDTALMEVLLFDGPHTILSVSPQRTFRGALRRAVQVRDRRCQHLAGCTIRALDADVDHIRPYAEGGLTSQFNGRVGCRGHNRHPEHRDDPTPWPERSITERDIGLARRRWRYGDGWVVCHIDRTAQLDSAAVQNLLRDVPGG